MSGTGAEEAASLALNSLNLPKRRANREVELEGGSFGNTVERRSGPSQGRKSKSLLLLQSILLDPLELSTSHAALSEKPVLSPPARGAHLPRLGSHGWMNEN